MKKTYKKNKGKVRKSFRKTLKQYKKFYKKRERKIRGGTGSLYAYPAQANFWEEGVSKFRSSPAYLSGGSKSLPLLPANMPLSSWNNVWEKKSAIFDEK